jgi:hypothetical protein
MNLRTLPKAEQLDLFFKTANDCGLVVDGHYIDGIPSGDEDSINTFYLLEDILEYPQPQEVPPQYICNSCSEHFIKELMDFDVEGDDYCKNCNHTSYND